MLQKLIFLINTRVISLLLLLLATKHSWIPCFVYAYYDTYACFGTPQGDCQINTYMQEGGFNDPNYRWLMECQDQEALFGIYDNIHNFESVAGMWCKNVFPLKPPSMGSYPYYPYCTYRDLTSYEHYCFDWRVPDKTYDTFVTGFYDPIDEELVIQPVGVKCCRTPLGYHIVYPQCYYKYTHDQHGEHFDGFWLTICDDSWHVIVGVGQALNPWDREVHFVWIMCCPIVFVGDVDSTTFLGVLTTQFGALDVPEPVYQLGPGSGAAIDAVYNKKNGAPSARDAVPHDDDITKKYGYAASDKHNVRYPNITLPSANSTLITTTTVNANRVKRWASQEEHVAELNRKQRPEVRKQEIQRILASQKLLTGNEFVVEKHDAVDKAPPPSKILK